MAGGRTKHIIIANAPIENGNRGCTALTYSAIILIDKIAQAEHFDYKIYLPDSGMRIPKESEIDINGKKITLYPIRHLFARRKSIALLHYFAHPTVWLQTLKLYKNITCVLDLGQGDSFADIYGAERFRTIDLIHRECRILNRPYCFMPQTIGPFKSDNIRQKAIKSLSAARLVMTRDEQSYDYATKELKIDNVISLTDLAFFLPYKPLSFDKSKVNIGLNISALLWNNGYTGKNEFELKLDYKETIKKLIEHFLSFPDTVIHLVAHVVNSEHQIENDYEICSGLYYQYASERVHLAPLFLSPIEAKNYISGLDLFIGARMHSTIAAFSSKVPVVPMSYSRKFEGLFCDTLGYKHVVNMRDTTAEETIAMIDDVYNHRQSIKLQLQKANKEIVEPLKEEMTKQLSEFINGHN